MLSLRLAIVPAIAFLFTSLEHAPAAARHAPILIRHRAGSNVTSTNWSGYAVTGANGSVTAASGSWIVPTVTCSASNPNQYSSFWVGIDGYSSNTVEQIGTDSDCQNGQPVYYAWYEFYPHFSYNIAMTVNPGDTINAQVSYSGGNFIVTLTDPATHGSFTLKQKMANAKMSSAEWIAEAPYSGGVLPLADFGDAMFSNCTATVGKTSGGFAAFNQNNVFAITMDNPDGATSVPSSFMPSSGSDPSSFNVQYYPPGS